MKLNKLYKMQEELDRHILGNLFAREEIQMSKEELLDNTILALLVEVGELANTTRCFKHWSTKGMMDKEVVLDELADVWHFYLSIGNQLGYALEGDLTRNHGNNITETFITVYYWINEIGLGEGSEMLTEHNYEQLGNWISILWNKLNFTDQEVEQAYLKKHEENYKRQREGY